MITSDQLQRLENLAFQRENNTMVCLDLEDAKAIRAAWQELAGQPRHPWQGQRVIRVWPRTWWQKLLRVPARVERGVVARRSKSVVVTDEGLIRGSSPKGDGWELVNRG